MSIHMEHVEDFKRFEDIIFDTLYFGPNLSIIYIINISTHTRWLTVVKFFCKTECDPDFELIIELNKVCYISECTI